MQYIYIIYIIIINIIIFIIIIIIIIIILVFSTCGRLSLAFDITGYDDNDIICYYVSPVCRDSATASQNQFNIITF